MVPRCGNLRYISGRFPQRTIGMEFIRTNDGEHIAVRHVGSGPPLIILHGWTSNHMEWLPYAEQLSEHYTVYLWDARGHGGHAVANAESVTIGAMARDLAMLMARYDLTRSYIVAHSMGALTLWEYLSRFGENRVDRICIIDQSPKLLTDEDWPHGIYGDFDDQRNRRFVKRLREDFPETVLQLAAHGLNARIRSSYERNTRGFRRLRAYLSLLDPEPLIPAWETLVQSDYRELLTQLRAPTLLVFGSESQFYRPSVAQWVNDQLIDSRLALYEGADHSPHLLQRERFIDDLLAHFPAGNPRHSEPPQPHSHSEPR